MIVFNQLFLHKVFFTLYYECGRVSGNIVKMTQFFQDCATKTNEMYVKKLGVVRVDVPTYEDLWQPGSMQLCFTRSNMYISMAQHLIYDDYDGRHMPSNSIKRSEVSFLNKKLDILYKQYNIS